MGWGILYRLGQLANSTFLTNCLLIALLIKVA